MFVSVNNLYSLRKVLQVSAKKEKSSFILSYCVHSNLGILYAFLEHLMKNEHCGALMFHLMTLKAKHKRWDSSGRRTARRRVSYLPTYNTLQSQTGLGGL
jgi:hypothetical protein